MALEDLAMFRAINNCVVFYPSDAVSCERAVELSANIPSMCYIRTSRPATLNVHANDEKFEVGKGKVSLLFFSFDSQNIYTKPTAPKKMANFSPVL